MAKRPQNARFAREMLKRILAVHPHPLDFLVDRAAGTWLARRVHGQEQLAFQVGHAESLHAGGKERLFIEDADGNQWDGHDERIGVIFQKTGVLIGGVHVEMTTAQRWERLGEIKPRGTVENAVLSDGWDPDGGN